MVMVVEITAVDRVTKEEDINIYSLNREVAENICHFLFCSSI